MLSSLASASGAPTSALERAPETVAAILTMLPLDDFVDAPMHTMDAGSGSGELVPVKEHVQAVIDEEAGRHWPMGALERFAFYEAARGAYAVVLTGERRLFGNVLIRKDIISPPE
ncbi:MAG: RbsD/FucU domain-containing protein [Acidimicrobiales bacterium]